VKNEIDEVDHKKQQALDTEDFEAAHKYAILKEKIYILQQESQYAEQMAKCCQEVEEERRRRFETFAADKERLHKDTIKRMEQQRAAIESEKSEIAFDLDMWSQNHTDLDERMEEAVQEEVKRKKTLEATSESIQVRIIDFRNVNQVADP